MMKVNKDVKYTSGQILFWALFIGMLGYIIADTLIGGFAFGFTIVYLNMNHKKDD